MAKVYLSEKELKFFFRLEIKYAPQQTKKRFKFSFKEKYLNFFGVLVTIKTNKDLD